MLHETSPRGMHVLQCVAVCCSVLQCVAVCCSVLQCVVHINKTPASVCLLTTHCETSQHVATHCNTTQHTQHTATHRNTLQHTTPHCATLARHRHLPDKLFREVTRCNALQHTAACCIILQHFTTTRFNTRPESVTVISWAPCNTLRHTATHCNTLQHRAAPGSVSFISLQHIQFDDHLFQILIMCVTQDLVANLSI